MRKILGSLVLVMFVSMLTFGVIVSTVNSQEQTVSGEIDSEVFSASVPQRMVLGETYRIIVPVKNTGDATKDFLVNLSFPFWTTFRYLYSPDFARIFTLFPGDSHTVEFSVTAVDTHIGPLMLKVDLYSWTSNQSELVDTVSSTIYEIRTNLAAQMIFWIFVLVILCAVVAFAINFVRKPYDKRELLTVVILFLLAISLRASNLAVVAPYPDEATGMLESMKVLQNNWN